MTDCCVSFRRQNFDEKTTIVLMSLSVVRSTRYTNRTHDEFLCSSIQRKSSAGTIEHFNRSNPINFHVIVIA